MKEVLNIIQLSEKLLIAVKMQENTFIYEQKLSELTLDELQKQLVNDDDKKVFWINCYNAFFQLLAKRNELVKKSIFKSKLITIANTKFSLDNIEHGILRKYRWKLSFGYLPNIFASKIIKSLAVSKLDFRIHFALNCGAKSCPPIAFYTLEKIDNQLQMAMISFLESETFVDYENKKITTSKLIYWYQGDFGGRTKILTLLKQVLNLKEKEYKLLFSKYSWETQLENYSS
ncbi:Protein of unknown function [Flavobacterium indicum GPTSA100-9 = DSM 17447]|uniref:DUF547 domain-containing protein n=1 Tax=Flavobacterium indicum (strain DSM 17447 / CIP 109464 / GPTSA100-9) TaxID=1094466 RepID=H8XTL8_FLAIG|nr:DUF547 domain-containing protein [Flavobacterium indicum]CCG53598.1 Protein of unknown function [Flavobacterium indicum GPTSA100-9 = DSM 17447]